MTDGNNLSITAQKNRETCELSSVVGSLCSHIHHVMSTYRRKGLELPLPSRNSIIEIVESLRAVIFPGYFGTSELDSSNICFHVGATLDHVRRALQEQIKRGLCFSCDDTKEDCSLCSRKALDASEHFMERLPAIQQLLTTDVQAAYEGDPAAMSPDECIFCYPGILAITNHRIAHELYRLGIPLIPRIISEHAHSITGIDIHPGATIGESFFIDHGTGVVIGETAEIGKNVRLYQGVTLGAKSFPLDADGKPIKGIKRHPIVEDDVIIYSGATVLGRITLGKGSVIGGNVWLTSSIPPGTVVTQAGTKDGKKNSEGKSLK
ncbi:MAG: serine O-acetyltransferase EpsC [Candidatus Eremiobacteraeota bacterium]|nr:serine O-acetyltransferase EpsC [Candidatus Eremiobacteraeota bacterium]